MTFFVSLQSFRSDTNAAHVEFWLDKGYALGFFTWILQCQALFNSCSIFILYYPYVVQEVHHHDFLPCVRLHVWPGTWQDIQYSLLTDHHILTVTTKIRILLNTFHIEIKVCLDLNYYELFLDRDRLNVLLS